VADVVPFVSALALFAFVGPPRVTLVLSRLKCSDRQFIGLSVGGIIASAVLFSFVRFNFPLSQLTDDYYWRALIIATRGVFG